MTEKGTHRAEDGNESGEPAATRSGSSAPSRKLNPSELNRIELSQLIQPSDISSHINPIQFNPIALLSLCISFKVCFFPIVHDGVESTADRANRSSIRLTLLHHIR